MLAVGFGLTGCADISFGSLGSTDQHSFAEASNSAPEEAATPIASMMSGRRVAMRGTLTEPETKLSGMDDRSAPSTRQKPEEIELAERVNPQVVVDRRHLQCVR